METVLASRDLAFNISGAAGTGKTDLLKDVRRGRVIAFPVIDAFLPDAHLFGHILLSQFESEPPDPEVIPNGLGFLHDPVAAAKPMHTRQH